MKFIQISTILAVLVPAIAAMPANEQPAGTLEARGCGASGSCEGFGGDALCNDRCKKCSGPSGKYARGTCGGFLGQTCECFYS